MSMPKNWPDEHGDLGTRQAIRRANPGGVVPLWGFVGILDRTGADCAMRHSLFLHLCR
jgi:hypothetical protein